MRLKEIKPGMVIHCKNSEEKNLLLEEAERLGYVWYGTKGKPTERSVYAIGDTIHFYDAGTTAFSADYKHITHSSCIGDPAIEFSDLIVPEMSAEEAFSIYKDICKHYFSCEECPLSNPAYTNCGMFIRDNSEKAIDIMGKWKSDHEKKEPEIETVDVCRIIKILPDRKMVVHEEDIKSELPFGGDERQKVEEILKHYCMEHDGEYIAVNEVVSRVKAVE